jgi:uncharacterized membrane protein
LLSEIKAADAAITALNTNAGRNAATPSGAENNSAENAKMKKEQTKIAETVETKLEDMKEVVKEADEMKASLTAIATEFRIPKDRLIAKRTPQEPTAAERINAILENRKEKKTIRRYWL